MPIFVCVCEPHRWLLSRLLSLVLITCMLVPKRLLLLVLFYTQLSVQSDKLIPNSRHLAKLLRERLFSQYDWKRSPLPVFPGIFTYSTSAICCDLLSHTKIVSNRVSTREICCFWWTCWVFRTEWLYLCQTDGWRSQHVYLLTGVYSFQ